MIWRHIGSLRLCIILFLLFFKIKISSAILSFLMLASNSILILMLDLALFTASELRRRILLVRRPGSNHGSSIS